MKSIIGCSTDLVKRTIQTSKTSFGQLYKNIRKKLDKKQ